MSPSPMDVDTANDGRPRLAQELLDLVLDHLHHDPESLKRSALVSKSLVPTCQRHLFSTYQMSKSSVEKLGELFADPPITVGRDENATLRPAVADLFNTYTTHLILADHPTVTSEFRAGVAHLPQFKNVQRITFKGDGLSSGVTIPCFLVNTWKSPSSRLRSVELDFRRMNDRAILESLCVLPATIEDVGFTCTTTSSIDGYSTASSIRRNIEHQRPGPGRSRPQVHQFSGTLKLRLSPEVFHERLLPVMLELKDLFKFSLKRISCRLTCRADVGQLAFLVGECKDTLQFLDIPISSPRSYGFQFSSFDFSSHRTLRNIRIWTHATFDPEWLITAIATIPKPSSTNPRVPPLRIEIHISLPYWMMYPDPNDSKPSKYKLMEIDRMVTPWTVVDTQLSQLIGLGPDATSGTSVTDDSGIGIHLDITIPKLTTELWNGIPAMMLPVLSTTKFVRLV